MGPKPVLRCPSCLTASRASSAGVLYSGPENSSPLPELLHCFSHLFLASALEARSVSSRLSAVASASARFTAPFTLLSRVTNVRTKEAPNVLSSTRDESWLPMCSSDGRLPDVPHEPSVEAVYHAAFRRARTRAQPSNVAQNRAVQRRGIIQPPDVHVFLQSSDRDAAMSLVLAGGRNRRSCCDPMCSRCCVSALHVRAPPLKSCRANLAYVPIMC